LLEFFGITIKSYEASVLFVAWVSKSTDNPVSGLFIYTEISIHTTSVQYSWPVPNCLTTANMIQKLERLQTTK